MDEHQNSKQVDIILPTAEEVRDGHAKVQMYWPTWKQKLGLLVTSENDLGLVVSAIEYAHDDFGFELRLAVLEKIVAHSDFEGEEYSVACLWNQPYLSFGHDGISAPYSFYLHFGDEGVERARELNKYLCEKLGELYGPRMLRSCFGPDGPKYLADMMSRHKE